MLYQFSDKTKMYARAMTCCFLLLFYVTVIQCNGRAQNLFLFVFRRNHKLNLPSAAKAESSLVQGIMQCLTFCVNRPWCNAGNWKVAPDINGLHRCQALSSDEHNADNTLAQDSLYWYFRFKEPIRTCADLYKSGSRVSGIYYVWDEKNHGYPVFCDMTSEKSKVYTMVMSQTFANLYLFKHLPMFKDAPMNQDQVNWYHYRLSLARMSLISNRSTHWRITCNYPQEGLKYVDYVRGKISDLNMLTFLGDSLCRKVEYIQVFNHNCSDCTASWYQGASYTFHHDIHANICQFGATPGAAVSEDVFGYYESVGNKFRCSSSPTSSTNHWFGSNV